MCLCVGRPPPGLMYGVAPVQRGFGPPPGWRPQFQFAGHPASPATRPMSAGPRPNPDTAATQRPPVTEQSAASQPRPRPPVAPEQLPASQPRAHPRPPVAEQPAAGQPQPCPPITEQSSASQPHPGMQFVPTQVIILHVTTVCLVM